MYNNNPLVFEVVADTTCLLNAQADLRDMMKLCCVSKKWQDKVEKTTWFWNEIKKGVVMHHIEDSQANLKFHIRENIKEIRVLGFEQPRILGISQIGFINLCARTLTRVGFYAEHCDRDQLGPLRDHMPTIGVLGAAAATIIPLPIPAEERQNLLDDPMGYEKDIELLDLEISQTPVTTAVYKYLINVAHGIDIWINESKQYFDQAIEKTCWYNLPHEIGLFGGLKILHLYSIPEIPKDILKLSALTTLTIEKKRGAKRHEAYPVPDFISKLTGLKKLNIIGCKMTELPKKFSKLANLTSVILKGNCFREFPKALFALRKLKNLNLTSNKIRKVGKGIENMHALKGLALQNNAIESLPKSIVNLPRLERLTICNNPIKSLPKGLCIEHLSKDAHTKSPKSQPPSEIDCHKLWALSKDLNAQRKKLEKKIEKRPSKKPTKAIKIKLEEIDENIDNVEKTKIQLRRAHPEANIPVSRKAFQVTLDVLGALGPQQHKMEPEQQQLLKLTLEQQQLLEAFEREHGLPSDQDQEFEQDFEEALSAKRKNPFEEEQEVKKRRR